MAIPLIQNVEKQDINTSIIAIRRQLEQLYNALGVTENTVSSEDISKSTGTPLGTWASFENDYAPNIEWLQGGTTFNPNTYPALAMYLGGNTVPERFDHSRLGSNIIRVDDVYTTPYTMLYDGIVSLTCDNNNRKFVITFPDGTQKTINTGGVHANENNSLTLELPKGTEITVDGSANYPKITVQYYTHPLFIKATPTSADSDYEGTLNAIREFYVRNNTYSTEERLTGGVWIDGKPIYRRTFVWTTPSSTGWRDSDSLPTIPNIFPIKYSGYIEQSEGYIEPLGGVIVRYKLTTGKFNIYCGSSPYYTNRPSVLILDYTKTTD